MELDDDVQLGRFLTMNGVLDEARLGELQAHAEATERPLYVTLIEDEIVDERTLVEMMSRVLGVRSVVLETWEGEPEVLRMLSNDFIRERGVLPLGIDLTEEPGTLYVAMANPSDEETLAEVRAAAGMPVLAVLAGPGDLLHAIHRNIGADGAMPPPPPPASNNGGEGRPTRASDLFASVDEIVDFYDEPSNLNSALSILDDIPDDRHERDTSPSGIGVLDVKDDDEDIPPLITSPQEVDDDDDDDDSNQHLFKAPDKPRVEPGSGLIQAPMPGKASESALPIAPGSPRQDTGVTDDIANQTGMGLPSTDGSGAFPPVPRRRVEKPKAKAAGAGRDMDYRKASAALLSRAAVKLLIEKGVLDEDELNAELAAMKR